MAQIGHGLLGPQEYVPEFGGNRFDKEPWWIVFEQASREEMDTYRAAVAHAGKGKDVWSMLSRLHRKVIIARVTAVYNGRFHCTDGAVREPSDGKDLWEALKLLPAGPSDDIEEEIFDIIMGRGDLEAGLRKKLLSRSATSAPTGQVGGGPARTAGLETVEMD